jgi:hypothetical protein
MPEPHEPPANNSICKELTNATGLAAVAKLVIAYERARTTKGIGRTGDISSSAAIQRVWDDELLRETVGWVLGSRKTIKALGNPSAIAMSFYILAKGNPAQVKGFMESFRDGVGLHLNSPIRRAREYLLGRPGLSKLQIFEVIVRAWNAWIEDRDMEKFLLTGNIPTIIFPKKGDKTSKAA